MQSKAEVYLSERPMFLLKGAEEELTRCASVSLITSLFALVFKSAFIKMALNH